MMKKEATIQVQGINLPVRGCIHWINNRLGELSTYDIKQVRKVTEEIRQVESQLNAMGIPELSELLRLTYSLGYLLEMKRKGFEN